MTYIELCGHDPELRRLCLAKTLAVRRISNMRSTFLR
jgi:hypothetical protein